MKSILYLTLAVLLFVVCAWGTTRTFTSDASIGCNDLTLEGYDITVNGCTVTIDCAHNFNSLSVINGGVVTHAAAQAQGMRLTVTGDVNIAAGCRIDVNAKGNPSATGPGAGVTGTYDGGGAGYGGMGGNSASVAGGVAYGSVSVPLVLGSGGGGDTYYAQIGGSGGGLVRLVVQGTLTVNGSITAGGTNGDGSRGGGGSGGAIYLQPTTFSGAGDVAANGGSGGGYGGGGSGGRIAVIYTSSSFSGTFSACGGSGAQYGGAGTVYTRASGAPLSNLTIGNNDALGAATPLSGSVSSTVTVEQSAILQPTSALTLSGSLIVRQGAQIQSQTEQPLSITVGGKVSLDNSSSIVVSGRGYAWGTGPGRGATGTYDGGGGGCGGYGGFSDSADSGGVAYGSMTAPVDLGSGGGGDTYYAQTGGAGGGAVHLTVTDSLIVLGTIQANGVDGFGSRGGGGSGGSIYLQCGNFSGNGALAANGGSGGGYGGGGSGGRIAVYFATSTFSGVLQAFGGLGSHYGGAGTVLTKANNASLSNLTLSNNGNLGAATPLIGTQAVHLIITQSAILQPTGALTINGNLVVDQGGQIQSLTLQTLPISVGGKMIVGASGVISVTGRGYGWGAGPGVGVTGTYSGGGGGHGGYGGIAENVNNGGLAYGSLTAPVDLGSGGGGDTYYAQTGGAGGGAVHLTVTDSLIVMGTIEANGLDGIGNRGGGGSGGSIYLQCGSFSGNGLLAASGGSGGGYGGGGSGGRVAVYAGSNVFAGSVITLGGAGWQYGAAGTILKQITGQPLASLVLMNAMHDGASTPLSGSLAVNLTVDERAVLQPPSALSVTGDLTVGTARIQATVGQVLRVSCGGDFVINAQGTIVADQCGYAAATGPGAGQTGTYTGGGGGYGGAGGTSDGDEAGGGAAYGFTVLATEYLGSGGGNDTYFANHGGSGGGAVHLTAQGGLQLDGDISANGQGGEGGRGGGGSGGGIFIGATGMSGLGTIHANGAGGGGYGGGGSGGRIALYVCNQTFDPSHCLVTGGPGAQSGANGTLWTGIADLNGNGIPDGCDIFVGTSSDGNGDGIPDETEVTSNATVVTVEYTSLRGLLLYWPYLAGYSQYIVYGKHGSAAEVPLATVTSSPYDATYLLSSGPSGDCWKFSVRGYRP